MSDGMTPYEDLQNRFNQSEAALNALRLGEIDLLIGAGEPMVVRLKSLEEEKERLGMLLDTVRRINQLIIHENNILNLLQSVVDCLCDNGLFHAARILQLGESGRPDLSVWSKKSGGYANTLLAEDDHFPYLDQIIASPESFIIPELKSAAEDCKLRGGQESCCLIGVPLNHDGEVFGAILILAPGSMFKEVDAHKLCREIGGDLGFALYRIRNQIAHRAAVENLKQSEKQNRLQAELLYNAPIIASYLDLEYNLVWANQAYERNSGATLEGLVGKKCYAVRGLPKKCSNCPVTQTFETGAPYEAELTPQNQEDWPESQGYWLSRAAPVRDDNGDIIGAVKIAIDIKDRKLADTKNAALQSQLQQAQKMESIGTLAGGIAHDFNNILASILGFSELALADVEKDTELEKDLNEIFAAGKRAKDLVKQILTFARKSDVTIQPVKVSDIAKEVIQFIRASIPTTIQINGKIESDALIMGSATQVHQIFMNLCTNAAFAMEKEGGILEISLKDVQFKNEIEVPVHGLKPGRYLEIKVSDTGTGIPQHIIDQIFEPYFTTKKPEDGTGMGLSVIHGIVETHGGMIRVDSSLGMGTCFNIYLPRVKKNEAPFSFEADELPRGCENILIIDDEGPIVKILNRMLSRLGYCVTTMTSSTKALEVFSSSPGTFDLVISDITMPKMTGDVLAAELMAIRPEIPIILCTGYNKKISDDSLLKMGIKAFVYKPIVKADLARIVRNVLDENKN